MTLFDKVIGQQNTKARLLADLAAERVAHALMLCGPLGAGKLALAVAYAQALLCQHPHDDGSPCGECISCRMAQKLEHPDLHFSFPIVRGNRIKDAKDAVSDYYIKEWRANGYTEQERLIYNSIIYHCENGREQDFWNLEGELIRHIPLQ